MNLAAGREEDYGRLFRGLVRRMVLVSALPILLVGGLSYWLFSRMNREVVVANQTLSIRQHRQSIEAFLDSRTRELAVLAARYTRAELTSGELERVFPVIQGDELTDIGVIDASGDHLRYVGPFDLAARNYRDADWFREVVRRGVYVSDVFLGFRGVPHFVIAVRRDEGDSFWILRATVNTDFFSGLVDAARTGRTGESFVVSSQGLVQTETRAGSRLLEPSGYPDLAPHDDIRVRELTVGGRAYLCTATWLARPRWLLLYRQEVAEAFAPLRRASLIGALVCLCAVAAAAGLAVAVARRQVRTIRQADREKAALGQRLLAAGRTAAVGEMSAGLAHEINNPLAIIETLQTWIRDLTPGGPVAAEDAREIADSARKIGEQVERCRRITQGLLKFSRRVESRPEPVDLAALLADLVVMARTRARVEDVIVEQDLAALPPLRSTAAHLQQIFLNLLNNAIDAVDGRRGGRVTVGARREGGEVRVTVADNGCGIAAEHLPRIFMPFFTTKPVGRGTGLGLAICYGLVHELGGSIAVDSAAGAGTTFTVTLPLAAAPARDAPAAAPAAAEPGGRS